MGSQHSQLKGQYYSTKKNIEIPETLQKKYQNWQESLPDELSIADVNIPGTHNSLALYGVGFTIKVSQCQSWDITTQLKAGIRYLDVRGKQKDGKFKVYHGVVYQKQLIQTVMKDIYRFLDENPKEFIVMSMKYEQYDKDCHDKEMTQSFESLVSEDNAKDKYWIIDQDIPSVKQARGKIFLIAEWRYNKALKSALVNKQDAYNANIKDKKMHVSQFSERAQYLMERNQEDSVLKKTLCINYLSGCTSSVWPLTFAKSLNKHFIENCPIFGIIAADFPDEEFIYKIIESNQKFLDKTKYKIIKKNIKQAIRADSKTQRNHSHNPKDIYRDNSEDINVEQYRIVKIKSELEEVNNGKLIQPRIHLQLSSNESTNFSESTGSDKLDRIQSNNLLYIK